MLELFAQGPDRRQRVRSALLPGRSYQVGRTVECDLPVPWDGHISRRHVRLDAASDYVDVQRLPEARNPLFFAGEEVETCRVHSGEQFVLGNTSFVVSRRNEDLPSSVGRPLEEVTFDPQELQKIRYRDADTRISVLSRLPEVIWGARSDSEFYDRLTNLLLAGVSHSDAVAVVKLNDKPGDGVELLHQDRRRETAGAFRPSSRLARDAIQTRRRTVLHVWEPHNRKADDYTAAAEFDWAFCTPVSLASGDAWGLYVAGRLGGRSLGKRLPDEDVAQIQADVKFTELVAQIINSVQRLKKLEGQHSAYRRFFPATVLSMLGEDLDTELLEPRECNVAVLFCDLRGFSHRAEESADDLIGLLERVSGALAVMRRQIDDFGGVTADFQGDAALGFWGWPLSSDEAALNACRAALGIRRAFEEISHKRNHPLADFKVGIGIAYGRGVSGAIGTADQLKVTVFGPVVNLASRLETMTKQLRVPIVLDEATAEAVRARFPRESGRVRRLAKVLPAGMETPLVVSELLPPASEFHGLSDEHLARYDEGVERFIAGRWEEAYRCLHEMPTTDRAQDFLSMVIAQHNRVAPPDWDGVIRMSNK